MKKRGLHRALQMKVKKYLEYMYEEAKNNFRDNAFIRESLSMTLRDEMLLELYGKTLRKNKLLNSNFSDLFLNKLALCFHEQTFGPDDNIILVIQFVLLKSIGFYRIQRTMNAIYFSFSKEKYSYISLERRILKV